MKQGKHVGENGTIEYYKDDQLHRDDNLPAVVWADGAKFWCQNDLLHRDGDQPAAEWTDGTKIWFQNDKRHRLTGPAWTNSNGIEEYWIKGERLTKKQHANHPEVKKAKLQQILNRLTA
jgi:hypothetical protein